MTKEAPRERHDNDHHQRHHLHHQSLRYGQRLHHRRRHRHHRQDLRNQVGHVLRRADRTQRYAECAEGHARPRPVRQLEKSGKLFSNVLYWYHRKIAA